MKITDLTNGKQSKKMSLGESSIKYFTRTVTIEYGTAPTNKEPVEVYRDVIKLKPGQRYLKMP